MSPVTIFAGTKKISVTIAVKMLTNKGEMGWVDRPSSNSPLSWSSVAAGARGKGRIPEGSPEVEREERERRGRKP